MPSIFARKVRTSSGATAVQIVRKDGRSDYVVLDPELTALVTTSTGDVQYFAHFDSGMSPETE